MSFIRRNKIKEKAIFVLLSFFIWLITYNTNKGSLFKEKVELAIQIGKSEQDTNIKQTVEVSYRAEQSIKNPKFWALTIENEQYKEYLLAKDIKKLLNTKLKNEVKIQKISPDTLWINPLSSKEIPLILALDEQDIPKEFSVMEYSWSPKSVSIKNFPGKDSVFEKIKLNSIRPQVNIKGQIPIESSFLGSKNQDYKYEVTLKPFTSHFVEYSPEKGKTLKLHIVAEVGYLPKFEDFNFKKERSIAKDLYWKVESNKEEIKRIKILNPWL